MIQQYKITIQSQMSHHQLHQLTTHISYGIAELHNRYNTFKNYIVIMFQKFRFRERSLSSAKRKYKKKKIIP